MKILLVQTSFLGDNILSTPVVEAIKSLYPAADLVVLTTKIAEPIYKNNPRVDEVIIYEKRTKDKGLRGLLRLAKELKRQKYDIVYSLHRSARTAILLFLADIPVRVGFKQASLSWLYTNRKERPKSVHEVKRNLSLLEPDIGYSSNFSLSLPVDKPAVEVFKELLGKPLSSYAVLVPGSVWATKRWSPREFRNTAISLIEEGRNVVLLGAPGEKDVSSLVADGISAIDLTGQTSLTQMFSIIKEADVVVCNDSMSLHVASTFKVPTVAVFCATSPTFGFGPWDNDRGVVVEKEDLDCKPCRRHGSHHCPTGTNACMEQLPAIRVIDAIKRVAG